MDIKIIKAKTNHIKDVSHLFNLYRQFYKYKSDLKSSTNYIKKRITNKDSTIFICFIKSNSAGFIQLYETFDSLNVNKKLILYDLYVEKKFRRLGIGRKLMLKAKKYAIKKKINIIELSTAINNKKAQALYESLDYKRDREYYNYYLEI